MKSIINPSRITARITDPSMLPPRAVHIQPFLAAVLREEISGPIPTTRLVYAAELLMKHACADAGGDAAHPRAVFYVGNKGDIRGRIFMDYKEIEKLVVEIGRDVPLAPREKSRDAPAEKANSRVGALESRMGGMEKLLSAIADRVGVKS